MRWWLRAGRRHGVGQAGNPIRTAVNILGRAGEVSGVGLGLQELLLSLAVLLNPTD